MSAFASLMTPEWVKFIGGYRATFFLLCALVSAAGVWWYRDEAQDAKASLALAQANELAAVRLAADYAERADKARAELAEATKAREVQRAARARKWERVTKAEPEWSETPVPDAVVEALR